MSTETDGQQIFPLVHCDLVDESARQTQMRYQGKITSWKDDQGFGFITPNGGGDRVFVHMKSFSNARRRPTGNELVTYELTADEKRRPRAQNVAFVGKRPLREKRSGTSAGPVIFAAFFLLFIVGAFVAGKLPLAVLVLYPGASAVAFCMYAHDKSAAKKSRWRIEENTLHFLALIGGWPGALLAQRILRHKSSKQSFQIMFWITVVLNCSVLLVFLSRTVMRTAHSLN